MKNYNFRPIFQNFNENFAIFTNFFKNFSNFSRKFTDKSEVCSSRGFRGGGGAPPGKEKISKISIQKPMKNLRVIIQNFNEKFCDFYKGSRFFRENLLTNQNYAAVVGSGGRSPPDAGENFKNVY